jgi:uncharacterized protein (DUF58 family)
MHSPALSPALLRPEHLVPIRNLALRAKVIVEGLMSGMHPSPYHGFSAEFREYRPYLPGEAARSIDWRKYAKTDRAVVRLFDDETNLRAHLLIDKSASMGFRSGAAMSKLEYASTLAASLAWILVRQRDAVGLSAFDSRAAVYMPPRSTNVQLKSMISHLQALTPSGETRCGECIGEVARRLRRRGLCIVISDLLDDPQSVLNGLRHLRFKRQDIIVFRVLDPLEGDFRLRGQLKMRDMESGREINLDAQAGSFLYRTNMQAHRQALERGCREMAVDFEPVTTDEPLARFLLRALDKRKRLR